MKRLPICRFEGLRPSPDHIWHAPTQIQDDLRAIVGCTPWRSLFRPVSIFLLGLVLAVVLWGLAYRLSLYHPHPDQSGRTNVAKLWVGPRQNQPSPSGTMVSDWSPMHRQPILLVPYYLSRTEIQRQIAFVPVDKEFHRRQRVLRSPPSQSL